MVTSQGGGSLCRRDTVEPLHDLSADLMKRIGTWALYVVGTVAIVYLALFAYAMVTRREFTPGKPIQIFRNPDAPSLS